MSSCQNRSVETRMSKKVVFLKMKFGRSPIPSFLEISVWVMSCHTHDVGVFVFSKVAVQTFFCRRQMSQSYRALIRRKFVVHAEVVRPC